MRATITAGVATGAGQTGWRDDGGGRGEGGRGGGLVTEPEPRPDAVGWGPPPGPQPGSPPAGQALPGWQTPPGWGGSAGAPGPGGGAPLVRHPGVLPLRPLGVGELLDGAVAVVRRYPRPVLGLAAVVGVVGTGLDLLLTFTLLRPLLDLDPSQVSAGGTAVVDALGAATLAGLIAVVLTNLAALVLAGLVAPAAWRGLLGEPLAPGQTWLLLRPRLRTLLAVALTVTAGMFGPAVLAGALTIAAAALGGGVAGALAGVVTVPAAVLLGLLLYVRWALAPVCAVLEGGRVRDALRRSRTLVRGAFWRVLGVLLLTLFLAGLVTQVLQVPFLLLTSRSPAELFSTTQTGTRTYVTSAVAALVASTLVGPFSAGVRGLLYLDRRMRAEGLDIAPAGLVAEGLDNAPAGPGAAGP